jgi:outer membrane protein OmpA-like peptidoglycan-associated protein
MSRRARLISLAAAASILMTVSLHSGTFTVADPPQNLGTPVNSAMNDFAPTLSPDGSYMIFNSNRSGTYQDLFISYYRDGAWQAPRPLARLNSPYNDESPFLSYDGTTLLFSSDRDGSIELPGDESGTVRVSFDLYRSKLVNGEWTMPERLPGQVNTSSHEKSPSLSRDGRTLYYCMWPFGEITRATLMTAEYRGEEEGFCDPKPMPAPFNSGYRDLALIPAEDLGGFFFSSMRPDSIGQFDLYFVSYKNGKFGSPENLGPRVNSPASEIYLSRADQRYFITSNRDGSKGLFDLYSAYIFPPETNFETRAIHFDFDKSEIKAESFPYLDALAKFLKSHGDIGIEIVGHTDLHGTDEYNNKLSLDRAAAVKKYLAGKGMDPARIRIVGAGRTRPVVNKTGEGLDELNRRTEFRILKST